MRFLLPILLLASLATAAEPYVGISAVQPLPADMHSIYRLIQVSALASGFPEPTRWLSGLEQPASPARAEATIASSRWPAPSWSWAWSCV